MFADIVPVIRKLAITSASSAVLGLILLIVAIFWPIHAPEVLAASIPNDLAKQAAKEPVNMDVLLTKTAGVRLIRPSNALAAVKDNGVAKKLLARMKLQGVTELAGTPVAYIGIEKMGTQTVKVGDSVLDFQVQAINPGQVTLSLDGVIVDLKY